MRLLRNIFATTILSVIIFLIFVFTTETGCRWVIQRACDLSGSVLTIEQVEGRLIDSLKLTDVKITLPAATAHVGIIEWVWQPTALLNGQARIAKLKIAGVRAVLLENDKDQSDDGIGKLVTFYFPMMIVVEQFSLNDLEVVNANDNVVFVLNYLQLGLEGIGNSLLLHEFDLKTPSASIFLHGQVDMVKGWQADILGNWSLAGFGFHQMDGTFSAVGSITDPLLQIGVHSPGAIRIKGQLFDLVNQPHWAAELDASGVDLSALILHCPDIELSQVHADLEGDFSSYQGKVSAEGEWHELKELKLSSEIKGNGQGIDFDFLRIDRPAGYAQAWLGKISWAEKFDWQGRFRFENFDLRIIDKQLQGLVTADIESVGKVVEKGVQSSFDISSLKGNMHDHNFSVVGMIRLDESSVFTDGLVVKSDGIEGETNIHNAHFSWAEEYDWNFQMHLKQFNPGFMHPLMEGQISGEINGQGSFPDNVPEAKLEIVSLSGSMRNKEIFGTGEISYMGGKLESPGLELRSGNSVLTVGGRAENDLALDFTFVSPELSELSPYIEGDISLFGSLTGNKQTPLLELELSGKELNYGNQSLKEIAVQLSGELRQNGNLAGQTRIEGFQLGSSEVSGQINIIGTLLEHQIMADLKTDDARLQVAASGLYMEKWQGSFDRLSLSSRTYGSWKIRDKAPVSLGPDGGEISNFCLTDQGQLVCLDAKVTRAEMVNWQGEFIWNSIPMSFLNKVGLPPNPLAGVLEGGLNFSGQSGFIESARLRADLLNPIIQFEKNEGEIVVIPLEVATLDSSLVDQTMNSRFLITSSDAGKIELVTTLEGVSELGLPPASYFQLPIKGNLLIDKFNSETFSSYTSFAVEPKGFIDSNLFIEGTLRRPEVYGTFALDQGGITVPSQGVTLEDVSVSLIARDNGARLHFSATSGPGNLVADGSIINGENGFEGDLKIKGEDFLLVNIQEYVLRVSPEVGFVFGKTKGEMKGRVKVPYGRITPEEMTNSIKESPDLIFVEGHEEIREKGWPFYLDLDVEIGDDVSVDGYGLTGKLGGGMNVKISPTDFVTGNGELLLKEGVFKIYGRALDIERGLVKFAGGPIDNPGLDVRAQKTVSDKAAKSLGYTVGVDISGLVQDLKFQLFSDPHMEETEILSQMIVGHSLANSSKEEGSLLQAAAMTLGIAGSNPLLKNLGDMLAIDDLHLEGSEKDEDVSLVVGKNLTKDLYIGYDINLFSELGQFRVRYDLTHGFWVETKSSSESTGADLLYTFER